MVKLSQKETMMLKDQKGHEEICIKKYNACASQAKDPALKQLFSSLAKQEEQHLNTINQILSGQVPSMSSSSSSSGMPNIASAGNSCNGMYSVQ